MRVEEVLCALCFPNFFFNLSFQRLELEMKRSGVGSVQVHPSNVGDALKAARRAEQAATMLQGAPAPKM